MYGFMKNGWALVGVGDPFDLGSMIVLRLKYGLPLRALPGAEPLSTEVVTDVEADSVGWAGGAGDDDLAASVGVAVESSFGVDEEVSCCLLEDSGTAGGLDVF